MKMMPVGSVLPMITKTKSKYSNAPMEGFIFTHFKYDERHKIFSLPDSVFRSFCFEINPSFGPLSHYTKFFSRDCTPHQQIALDALIDSLDKMGQVINWKDYKGDWGCRINKDCVILETWELDDGGC
jgi:hypothetical protein